MLMGEYVEFLFCAGGSLNSDSPATENERLLEVCMDRTQQEPVYLKRLKYSTFFYTKSSVLVMLQLINAAVFLIVYPLYFV